LRAMTGRFEDDEMRTNTYNEKEDDKEYGEIL
jgi:hypothetical protein